MPSWTQTQDFLRGRFRLDEDLPEQLGLTFVTQLVPGRNEAQHVRCVHETHSGEPWLLARADACREASLDPAEAVTLAARLRIGAISLTDGVYEVRRAFALTDLKLEELARDLQYLAMEASFVRVKARPLPHQPPRDAGPAVAPTPEPTEAPAAAPEAAEAATPAAAPEAAAPAEPATPAAPAVSESPAEPVDPADPPTKHWAE